ncbi:MAG: zinc-ribbon domain-containing protein [Candidatus Thiodiazotropha sp. (ex Monitilora ramsayi)]|nr:zinc-ribbon domain-containing protein [Candidatus Thiodiazotropha sp. (ex Monitilora ramsayi)]
MLTQCPHCKTLFRIGPEQLKVADGKVRCNQCNQVFNALLRLHESPVDFLQQEEADGSSLDADPTDLDLEELDTEQEETEHNDPDQEPWNSDQEETEPSLDDTESPPDDESPGSSDSGPEDRNSDQDNVEPDASTKADVDKENANSEYILEQDDGLETEPDYLDAGTESQMSELLDRDTDTSLLMADEKTEASAEVIEFVTNETPDAESAGDTLPDGYDFGDSILKDGVIDTLEGRPDYDSIPSFRAHTDEPDPTTQPPADDKALTFEADETATQHTSSRTFWLVGSLVLLILLSSQLTWQFRHELIQYDVGRQVLGLFCQIAGCEIPIRKDTTKIVIQERNLSTDPDEPDVLFMQLYMVNTAPYEQPYPKLQLSLYNDNGKLVARRIFAADEYLPDDNKNRSMMPKAETVLAEMRVIDPGNEVTGFSFDFL